MCFSVRKSKVQHVDNICPLIISAQHFLLMQFVSNSLFKATPLFEGSGEIRFLNFHLLCTWVNESHLPSGEMSGNLQHFLFVKGQHLFPKVTAWRCPFTYACACCSMLNCSEPPWSTMVPVQQNFVFCWASGSPRWYFASEHCAERPSSAGFLQTPASDFLKISVKGVHPCCGYSNIVFPQRNIFGAHPWGITVASFSLNTSLINAMWFQQCLLSYIF